MLSANVSKIKKKILPNIIFFLYVLSENGIILVSFSKIKKQCSFHKNVFFKAKLVVHP